MRDPDGRTYTAATVALPSLQLSALRLAVAMAVSSGARGLESAAVVTEAAEPSQAALAALRDLGGADVPVHVADTTGALRHVDAT